MTSAPHNFTVSVAPMMEWTDRHYRWFHRRLSCAAIFYTEMVAVDAVFRGIRIFSWLMKSIGGTTLYRTRIHSCFSPFILSEVSTYCSEFGLG